MKELATLGVDELLSEESRVELRNFDHTDDEAAICREVLLPLVPMSLNLLASFLGSNLMWLLLFATKESLCCTFDVGPVILEADLEGSRIGWATN